MVAGESDQAGHVLLRPEELQVGQAEPAIGRSWRSADLTGALDGGHRDRTVRSDPARGDGEQSSLLVRRCRRAAPHLALPGVWLPSPSAAAAVSECRSRLLAPEAVSGFGRVYLFTVNHYQWVPGFDPPYVVATVELVEQRDLHVLTNLVGCSDQSLRCDLEVEVCFAKHGEIFLPLFRPVRRRERVLRARHRDQRHRHLSGRASTRAGPAAPDRRGRARRHRRRRSDA